MSDLSTIFTNIADSIRNKANITNTMLPSEMPHYIDTMNVDGKIGLIPRLTINIRKSVRVRSSLALTTSVYESEE